MTIQGGQRALSPGSLVSRTRSPVARGHGAEVHLIGDLQERWRRPWFVHVERWVDVRHVDGDRADRLGGLPAAPAADATSHRREAAGKHDAQEQTLVQSNEWPGRPDAIDATVVKGAGSNSIIIFKKGIAL